VLAHIVAGHMRQAGGEMATGGVFGDGLQGMVGR